MMKVKVTSDGNYLRVVSKDSATPYDDLRKRP
jgi:hypothetical protein